MNIKSGYKTTEFWLSLAAIVLGAVLSTELLDGTLEQLLAAALSVLASLGYTVGRSSVKKAAAKESTEDEAAKTVAKGLRRARDKGLLAIPLLLSLTVASCGSWQETARVSLYSAVRAGAVAHDVARNACRPTLEKCILEKRNPCPALLKCQKTRRPVLQSLDSLMRVISAGLAAVELADRPTAEKAIAKTVKLLGDIKAGLSTWGM